MLFDYSFTYKLNECVSYTNAATSIFVCHVCVYPYINIYIYIYIIYIYRERAREMIIKVGLKGIHFLEILKKGKIEVR